MVKDFYNLKFIKDYPAHFSRDISPGLRILCLLKQTTKIPLWFSLPLDSNIFTCELNIAWPWNEIESVTDEWYRMHSAQSSLYLQARHVSRSPYTMWKFMIGWQASSRPCNPLTPLPATQSCFPYFYRSFTENFEPRHYRRSRVE